MKFRGFALSVILLALMVAVSPVAFAQDAPALSLSVLGTYATGAFEEGAQEIVAYHAASQTLFVVNAQAATVDLISIADPTTPTLTTTFDASAYGSSANSVAILGDTIAVAVQAAEDDGNGVVVFISPAGEFIASVEVGNLPDMVAISPDGTKAVVANEGEPNDDYSVDPLGSISIIDISGGVEGLTQDNVTTLTFEDFNEGGPRAGEVQGEVRIYGPNATFAQDVEPEYIAIAPDSTRAIAVLQENNALAFIDLVNGTITGIAGLGYKDHSQEGNALDAGTNDGVINIANWPIFGIYQPDGIALYTPPGGGLYLVTANEGDTRDYETYGEEAEIGEVTLDETAFPNAAELVSDSALGGLTILTSIGDTDGDGDLDQLYIPGARSFSIWDVSGENSVVQVYDSGADFETIIAERVPEFFNVSHTNNTFDNRSDNKGPEPESVVIAPINERLYAFIALERQSGIMVYDITDPTAPSFVNYVENRDYTVEPEAGNAGDLGPEGLVFIPAEDSPNGSPLLAVSNEVSGTTTVWQIDAGM
jgi:DNA-binding beta-propeller fold protein YncE